MFCFLLSNVVSAEFECVNVPGGGGGGGGWPPQLLLCSGPSLTDCSGGLGWRVGGSVSGSQKTAAGWSVMEAAYICMMICTQQRLDRQWGEGGGGRGGGGNWGGDLLGEPLPPTPPEPSPEPQGRLDSLKVIKEVSTGCQ